jgi:hypothetical protein
VPTDGVKGHKLHYVDHSTFLLSTTIWITWTPYGVRPHSRDFCYVLGISVRPYLARSTGNLATLILFKRPPILRGWLSLLLLFILDLMGYRPSNLRIFWQPYMDFGVIGMALCWLFAVILPNSCIRCSLLLL